MAPADFDADAARIYLAHLFDSLPGLIEVRSLLEGTRPERAFAADTTAALSAIARGAQRGRNVYVGVATRARAGDGSKRNLAALGVLWLDFDAKEDGDREALSIALERFALRPSLRVFSGGGEHLYWLLEEPLDAAEPACVAHAERILRRLAQVLGGDRAATDASRILRVPGTVNVPDQRKRDRGRVPVRAEILEANGYRYALEAFDEIARTDPQATVAPRVAKPSIAGEPIREGERNATLTSLAGSMRRRGMSDRAILAALREENAERCPTPLGDDELRRIARSVARYPAADYSHRATRFEAAAPITIDASALRGPLGEFVRLVEPHTEADSSALLVTALVMFGNAIGRERCYRIGADRHHANLFAVVVGESAKARKGTSYGLVRSLFDALDPTWAKGRLQSGLSSGEGLIHAVRDPSTKREPIKQGGRIVSYQEIEADAGVDDKRLLVFEAEFASVLRMIARDGNTLSAVVRDAWDRGDLRTLTKASPTKATGAHVSIIGHVTRDELRAELKRTDAANGFANRFLWVFARRSKLLPDGGDLDSVDLAPVQQDLRSALDFARVRGELRLDSEARERWRSIYSELAEGQPGMFGAVTSRAEPQVLRLALVYALLEAAGVVAIGHLEAALAVWRYCEASAAHAFGDAIGETLADDLDHALRAAPNGYTRGELRDLFSRNRSSDEIESALALLARYGRAVAATEATGGRPAERWHSTRPGYAGNAVSPIFPPFARGFAESAHDVA